MKRYLVFCFDDYYPGGGMKDFVGSFDTPTEAFQAVAAKRSDNYQIVDSTTGIISFSGFKVFHPTP